MAAYKKEIKVWPSLKPGDSSAYAKFYSFLIIIRTLSGDQEVASTVISGLQVANDMEGVRQHWLNLPATYIK